MSSQAIGSRVGAAAVSAATARSAELRLVVAIVIPVLVTIVASRISTVAFVGAALVSVVALAYVCFRAPRAMLVTLALAPLVDRYLVRLVVPADVQPFANMLTEALLVMLGAAIFVHGRRSGRLLPALRHPSVVCMAIFAGLAAASALVNGVPPAVAGLGTLYTIDAFMLFLLARVIGFDDRAATRAAGAFAALAVLAALLDLGQVVLAPDILGLAVFTGRFGEGLRPGSFFAAQPNLLGAVLGMAMPLATFAAVRPGIGRVRRGAFVAAAFLLALALLYTFSRGTWLALAVATVVTGLLLDRRVIGLTAVLGGLALATALILPRGILLGPNSPWAIDLGNAIFGRLGAIGEGNDLRFRFIANGVPIVVDHPLLGTGPGTYGGAVAARFGSPLYERYTAGQVPLERTVDNYWLHLLVESGIPGAALVAGALGVAIMQSLRAARGAQATRRVLLAAFAGAGTVLAFDSLTEMLLEGNTTSFPVWFLLGLATLLAARPSPPPEAVEAAPPSARG